MNVRGAHRMITPSPETLVGDLDLNELRALRRRAQREEADLSYLRRLLHGRIDILTAERHRRTVRDAAPLLDLAQLSRILADAPSRRRSPAHAAWHVTAGLPAHQEYRRLAEELMAEVELSALGSLDDEELGAALGRLAGYEARLSRLRQALHRRADACGAEIARRYRVGEARVDDLLA
ncbi:RsiG family protein [Streptomyces sp. 4N509B]|uniref:RsiG family protein n=1 Tax=Streptomyces sp. 4N509B TaxID=3457413 RepID=UPI003FD2FB9C